MENGKPAIYVEDDKVDLEDLAGALKRFVKSTHNREVLLDADGDVDWATIIAIQDAAKGAGIQHFHYLLEQTSASDGKK